jgi:hypothetical protein
VVVTTQIPNVQKNATSSDLFLLSNPKSRKKSSQTPHVLPTDLSLKMLKNYLAALKREHPQCSIPGQRSAVYLTKTPYVIEALKIKKKQRTNQELLHSLLEDLEMQTSSPKYEDPSSTKCKKIAAKKSAGTKMINKTCKRIFI